MTKDPTTRRGRPLAADDRPRRIALFVHASEGGGAACGAVELVRFAGGAWSIRPTGTDGAPAVAPVVYLPPGAAADDALTGLLAAIPDESDP